MGDRRGLPRIEVGLSWLVTYLLLMISLVMWVGPPGPDLGAPLARAIATILVPLLMLPMVIGHEVAHHLVARRAGVAPDVLRLRLVGAPGGTRGADVPPRAQAAIALAGPLLSLAFAGLLVALREMGQLAGWHAADLIGWVLVCTALANLVLGSVSLYPGRPLDGSEVVHAVCRSWTSDATRATALTTQVGVVAGWMVMLSGLLLAMRTDATAGLWLVLVGWLLMRAARLGQSQERLMDLVDGYTVGDALRADVAVVGPGLTLDTLLDQAHLGQGGGVYPVVGEGRLLGIIDVRDLRGLSRSRTTTLRVADRMRPIPGFPTLTPEQPLWDAVVVLERGRVSALPVVARDDHGKLLGLVSRTTVVGSLRGRRVGAHPPDEAPHGAPGEPPGDTPGDTPGDKRGVAQDGSGDAGGEATPPGPGS